MLSPEAQQKQERKAKLAKLLGKSDLSAKQRKTLAKLQELEGLEVTQPSDGLQAMQQQGEKRKGNIAVSDETGMPSAKRVYKQQPCQDQGHWGDDGDWVYPADRDIVCSTCSKSFVFLGIDQAWYAKRELYAPARCAPCLAAKKEAKEAKRQSGKSGEGRCFNCGAFGHGAVTCTKEKSEQKACYVCGSDAHLSRNCPKAGSAKGARGCFICGSTAHLSKECPKKPPPICFSMLRHCDQTRPRTAPPFPTSPIRCRTYCW